MTARYTWQQVAKELRGSQSTLTRADVRYRPREGAEWHDALVRKARLAMAEALRCVSALRRGSRSKARRAA